MNEIIQKFIELSGVSMEELEGPSRKMPLATVRHCIIYALLKSGYRDREVAAVFRRTRTNVYNSIIRVESLLFTNDELIRPYRALLETFCTKGQPDVCEVVL